MTSNISETMQDLIRTLNGLKNQRELINQDIENGEKLKIKIQEKLNSFIDELEKLNQSIEQKNGILNVYDKILSDSDTAYNKIVQSTEALYNMVKNEEKKIISNPRSNYNSSYNI